MSITTVSKQAIKWIASVYKQQSSTIPRKSHNLPKMISSGLSYLVRSSFKK